MNWGAKTAGGGCGDDFEMVAECLLLHLKNSEALPFHRFDAMKEDEDITKVEEKRDPKAKPDLHPKEDLSHGDEGVDDPAPEDATKVTTNFDGEPANTGE